MAEKILLSPGFIPLWADDLNDVSRLGSSAFILRQTYRLYRDPSTKICSLSDYNVQKILKWSRHRIINARIKLQRFGEIKQIGYHSFLIPDHAKMKLSTGFKSSAETALLEEKSSAKTALPVVPKQHQSSAKTAPNQCQNSTVHNIIDRKDVVDTQPDTIKTLLQELFIAQGQQGENLLAFFHTVTKERLEKRYDPVIIIEVLKRAIRNRTAEPIQNILSYENLNSAMRSRQAARQNDDLDRKIEDWKLEPRFEGTKKTEGG